MQNRNAKEYNPAEAVPEACARHGGGENGSRIKVSGAGDNPGQEIASTLQQGGMLRARRRAVEGEMRRHFSYIGLEAFRLDGLAEHPD